MENQAEVIEEILTYMQSGENSEESFNKHALSLFRYQYTHNQPYRKFCMHRGKTPRTVKAWQDIPPVPINAFKELPLSCINPEEAERVFMTSGTTKGVKGKHYHPSMTIWDYSMTSNFKNRFMKDDEQIKMGILFPSEEEMPNSSLARYLNLAFLEFGTDESKYLLGKDGIEYTQVIEDLRKAEETGEPYALLGATFSFVHLFEEMEKRRVSFKLPQGSRVLDTGGFKGQSKEMGMNEFYDLVTAFLGVPREECINMYGMTELCTQFYDDGNEQVPSVKSGPHWIRTRVVNPLTGQNVPNGQKGVLVHCDLANFNSVTAILTEDLGIMEENGFLLLGRVQGTEAKGCSLAVEEFIQASKGNSL